MLSRFIPPRYMCPGQMQVGARVSNVFDLATEVAAAGGALYRPDTLWGAADHLPRRNLLVSTATLATQTRTVTAGSHTLYIKGTGSVTLSGVATGTLNGTGASDRVSLVFTATAGNLTLTVSGTVTEAHLTLTSTLDHSYQAITDWTTEQYAHAAAKNVPWLRRNRFLNTATLSTQTVSSVTATPLTVSFTGTGTITFSTAYSGTLVGTGASDRVSATFTPTAGNLVCTVSGSVTLAQCEVGSTATEYQAVGASWDAQFALNAAAAGVTLTMRQDSAGTTPVSGPDLPIGLLLDSAQGLVAGANITPAFSAWQRQASWSVVGETLVCSGGLFDYASSADNTVSSTKTYRVSITISALSEGIVRVGLGTTGVAPLADITAIGNYEYIWTPTASGQGRIWVQCRNSGQSITVSAISCRELPGYHAIQAGATSLKPVLRLSANGGWWLQRDMSDDTLVATFPNLGSNCVEYVATSTGVVKTENVTLNGAKSMNSPATDYGRVYLPAPSTKDAQITAALQALIK